MAWAPLRRFALTAPPPLQYVMTFDAGDCADSGRFLDPDMLALAQIFDVLERRKRRCAAARVSTPPAASQDRQVCSKTRESAVPARPSCLASSQVEFGRDLRRLVHILSPWTPGTQSPADGAGAGGSAASGATAETASPDGMPPFVRELLINPGRLVVTLRMCVVLFLGRALAASDGDDAALLTRRAAARTSTQRRGSIAAAGR